MQRTRRSLRFAGIAFLLISASSVSAQVQVGSIVGELHVSRGDFPGRVLVELQLRGAPIASAYTDEQGKFGFPQLGNNAYHVLVSDERYFPVEQLVKLDLSVSSVAIVQINLSRREPVQTESLPNRGAGGNPFIIDTQEYRRKFSRNVLKEFDKGLKADQKGNRDDAIEHYEKALNLAPDFYPAHNNVGSDYVSRSDFPAAKSHFENAIRLNQSDSEAHLNLANVLLMMRDYDNALKNVQEGLQREPQSPFGQFLLGSIYQRLGKLTEAERALRQALVLDPTMSRVRLELVNLYLAQKKNLEATTELKAFLQNSPADPLAPKARALLLRLESAR